MSKKSILATLLFIGIMVFSITFVSVSCMDNLKKNQEANDTKSASTETSQTEKTEDTLAKLNSYIDANIRLNKKSNPKKGTVQLEETNLEDELPDLSQYPLKVTGTGDINIEIVSSPEKAGEENIDKLKKNGENTSDIWLLDIANTFNNSNFSIDGKTVSVSIRSMSSGLACDYMIAGSYTPDGFTPSNSDWAAMLQSKGIKLNLETEKLVGNIAGLVINPETYDMLIENYGSINIENVINATINNEIAMGYTNPYSSSTGLNFLMTSLYHFDSTNPLSSKAISGFQDFQQNVPFVAYNTMQMRNAMDSGALNVAVMEYQSYINKPTLSSYKFVPFGIRHDNPLYSVDGISEEKKSAFALFVEFALNSNSQSEAKKYGFNEYESYKSERKADSGATLYQAQNLWKKEKDNGQELVCVFIVDTSGSMNGTPLQVMQQSLINGGKYINPDSYVGLVSYNDSVTINLPIQKFDINHRAYFNGEVESLSAGGGTATFDAISVGMKMLEEEKQNHPDAKFMLFVLSDGESNRGHLEDISDFITSLQIPINTIGYNDDIAELKEISSINEAISIDAKNEDIVYQLKNLFNSQL